MNFAIGEKVRCDLTPLCKPLVTIVDVRTYANGSSRPIVYWKGFNFPRGGRWKVYWGWLSKAPAAGGA